MLTNSKSRDIEVSRLSACRFPEADGLRDMIDEHEERAFAYVNRHFIGSDR